MRWVLAVALLGLAGRALAEEPTLLPHPDDTRWWLSGQLNVIAQAHPSFSSPYGARAEIRQIIPLGDETAPANRGPLALAPRLPVRRLEIRAGKMSTVDV